MTRPSRKAAACAAVLAAGWGAGALAQTPPPPPPPAAASDGNVSTTILPGADRPPPASPTPAPARPGPVSLNFPSVDVQAFAKVVLGDVLGLPHAVDPSVHGTVTLVTPRPVAKADVLPMVEDALRSSGLALEPRAGVYTIVPLSEAKAGAPVLGPDQQGFGNETLHLRYASPVEVKKLIDPIVPGVIASADAASGSIVLTGATGQRRAVRELVEQFDMDWLKGMSFALYVPKNTDARLIAPELDKLINAQGSTVAGMVRLVSMEKLNGIIAIAPKAQYLDDVRRWVEVLDREGVSSERRLYVYRVQNGRAVDLSNVLVSAFGGTPSSGANPTSGQRSNQGRSLAGAGGGLSGTGATGIGAQTSSLSSTFNAATTTGSGSTLPGQSPAAAARPSGAVGAGETLVITADEANNAVVAYATPREYALIEDALRKLDITPLQVVIEASISEVTLNDTLQYGTQWFFQTHGNQYALTQGTGSPNPVQGFPGFGYTIFNNAGAIAATLSALSSVTHINVLSAPNLLVLNNQTASLEVGDDVPISTGSAVSTVSADAPVVNSIDYRTTGVILQITPRVNSSGLVLLDISQEVSQVNNTTAATEQNPIQSPIISERKISSSIAVQDGQTIALGGMVQDNITKTRTGIPFLSAIPILGALAGNRNETRQRTELLVLLTPRVIRSTADSQAVTEELKQKIRNIEPLRPKFEP